MNTRTPIINPWLSQRRIAFSLSILLLVISIGCFPAGTQPPAQLTSSAIESSPTPATTSANELSPTPVTPSPTATGEALIPAGWTTYTSRRCEYALGYPADMQVSYDSAYSRSFVFNLDNPEEGARNFVYVSVIDQEFQSLDPVDIYNYDPAAADLLLSLQVGESKAVHPVSDLAQWFTYQRLPDTTISGNAAQTYENVQPWEFPDGTKEMRYYLSLNGCTYQIGGYLDTIQSNQQGAITEDLFHQIVDTIRVMP